MTCAAYCWSVTVRCPAISATARRGPAAGGAGHQRQCRFDSIELEQWRNCGATWPIRRRRMTRCRDHLRPLLNGTAAGRACAASLDLSDTQAVARPYDGGWSWQRASSAEWSGAPAERLRPAHHTDLPWRRKTRATAGPQGLVDAAAGRPAETGHPAISRPQVADRSAHLGRRPDRPAAFSMHPVAGALRSGMWT